MALDVTLQEVAFRKSVKKFLVDSLYTTDGIYIGFETMFKEPETSGGTPLDVWINFHFDGLSVHGNTARGRVAAYLFSRRDADGSLLSGLRDSLMDKLIDLDMPDGLKRVPLYDATWQQVAGMIVTTGGESKEESGVDDTTYKFVNLYFNYATK